jgi:hypothetical protein
MPPIPPSPAPACSHRPAQPRYILLTQSARLLAASFGRASGFAQQQKDLHAACSAHAGSRSMTASLRQHDTQPFFAVGFGGRAANWAISGSKQKKAQHPRSLLTLFRPAPFGDACLAFCFAFACTPVTAGRSAGSHHTPSSSSYVYCYAMNAAITMEGTICAC